MELSERLRAIKHHNEGYHGSVMAAYGTLPIDQLYRDIAEVTGILEEALKALEECADDLESEVQQRWGYDERLAHKLERDLAPVVSARAILAKAKGTAQ